MNKTCRTRSFSSAFCPLQALLIDHCESKGSTDDHRLIQLLSGKYPHAMFLSLLVQLFNMHMAVFIAF